MKNNSNDIENYSVISLLNNYSENQSKLKLLGYKNNNNEELEKLKEHIDQLAYCINCLPEQEKLLITQLYISGISIRQLGKTGIMSRSSVVRRRDKAIKMLENLLKTLNS